MCMSCLVAIRPGFSYFSGQCIIHCQKYKARSQVWQRNVEQYMGRKVTTTKFSGPEIYHWPKMHLKDNFGKVKDLNFSCPVKLPWLVHRVNRALLSLTVSPPTFGSSWRWAKCRLLHHGELHGRDETAFPAPLPSRFPSAPAGLLPLLTPAADMWIPWASSPAFSPGSVLTIEVWSST